MLKFVIFLFFLTPLCFLSFFYLYIYLVFFFFFFFICSFVGLDHFMFLGYGYGLDKISFIFCCLSIWICLLMIFSMFNYFFNYFNIFMVYLNSLLFLLFLVFIVLDFFQFYFFFECSLIPVFLIIFGWGYQPERLSAGFFLILYTLFASFPFLLSIFFIFNSFGGFSFFFSGDISNFILMFFILFSFMVKFPLFGVHLWLPKAHVEAPVSGSMILAGVMLKLGGYGLIRCLKFLYSFIVCYNYFFISLSLFGCLIISLFCLIQSDLKILIAYSSVCHMSVVISGLMTLTESGFFGSLMFMVAHGFVSSGLFYLVGLIYDRLGSRSFFLISGLLTLMPGLSFFWFMFCVLNMSCPPSINLFSEIFLVISLLMWSNLTLIFFVFILFFSACYSLMIFSFTQHGEINNLLKFFRVCNVLEYMVLLLHMIPVFFLMFSLKFFFLFN